MIESLVVTLREGIEAALIIGIILAYLKRTGKTQLNRYVYIGLGLAVVASILGAVLFTALDFDPENEVLEGTMLLIGGIFVGSMVLWMQKTAKNIKQTMENKLGRIVESGADLKKQGWGLLAFAFFMVFREGIETVLFLSALSLGEAPVMGWVGGLLGIAMSVLFAYFFINGSLKINLAKFFNVTSLILMILVLRLFAGSAHEFAEVGLIPMTPAIMYILGLIVRDNSTAIISMIMLTLPIVMILLDNTNKPQTDVAAIKDPIARRQALAKLQQEKNWKYAVVGAALAINLVLGWDLVEAMTKPTVDPMPVTVTAQDGKIIVPIDKLDDGLIHKYAYRANGTDVKFLLIKREDGSIGSGLDACEICGPQGYYQEEDNKTNVICRNCNAPIPIPTIGFPGGCNPVAVEAQVDGDNVVIAASHLADKGVPVYNKKAN
ncbi:Fe-S-containing protein [Anaeroselena agilis]|uniref:Fe-S-containing protein n=1 Tax=Anaeroselena agilis TaxID=3063788 RepID=A0ABU3NTH6_9FIRM|nr:Fe-S-containing protein [Selenomonadales bacterium 4137-cl]